MNKLKWLLGLALLATLIWYFFLKKEHYQVRFTTAHPPGVVYQHIKDWTTYGALDSLHVENRGGIRYATLEQRLVTDSDSLEYHWEIWRDSDSITKVKAEITDPNSYWKRKFEVPFHRGDFVSENIKRVESVGKELVKKATFFKVHSISDTLFPSKFCAYVTLKDVPLQEKAKYMLSNISLVMGYIKANAIPLEGDPFLQVRKWDQEENTIDFDFCFPIAQKDSLPPTSDVLFKTTEARRYLKVVFNGNYRISDNAWYYLIDYAERKNIEIELPPTEVFLNDPHAGGNSLEWKAHILVPLKEKS